MNKSFFFFLHSTNPTHLKKTETVNPSRDKESNVMYDLTVTFTGLYFDGGTGTQSVKKTSVGQFLSPIFTCKAPMIWRNSSPSVSQTSEKNKQTKKNRVTQDCKICGSFFQRTAKKRLTCKVTFGFHRWQNLMFFIFLQFLLHCLFFFFLF